MNKRIRENHNNEHLNMSNEIIKTSTSFDYNKIWNIYSKLNKYPHEITGSHLLKLYPNMDQKYFDKHTTNDPLLCLIGFTHLNTWQSQLIDVMWTSLLDKITSREYIMPYNGEAYFGVTVYNCTYATIFYDNKYIDFVKSYNCFTLPYDVYSYDKPIFNIKNKCKSILYTDGDQVTYNNILFYPPALNQITKMCNI